jgi:hypothetical protein
VYGVNNEKMNVLEKIFNSVKDKDDLSITSLRCSNLFAESALNVRIFVVSIACLSSYDPYENESLAITLKVQHDGVIEKWLEMRKSTIRDGGFGVFAIYEFSRKELETVCLGEKIDYTSMKPKNWKSNGFQEEYWLEHRINHGSSSRRNLEMKGNMVICATKKSRLMEKIILGLQP